MDRLTEIKARLDKAINVSELCAHPAFDGKKVWFNEHYSREFSSTQHAELIAHCPDDIRWLMTELEKERAEHKASLEVFAESCDALQNACPDDWEKKPGEWVFQKAVRYIEYLQRKLSIKAVNKKEKEA